MANRKKSQTDLVLDYINANGGITTRQAYEDLGITRLSARIFELKHDRLLPIRDEFVDAPTRKGETTQVKKYYLPQEKEQLEMDIDQ